MYIYICMYVHIYTNNYVHIYIYINVYLYITLNYYITTLSMNVYTYIHEHILLVTKEF